MSGSFKLVNQFSGSLSSQRGSASPNQAHSKKVANDGNGGGSSVATKKKSSFAPLFRFGHFNKNTSTKSFHNQSRNGSVASAGDSRPSSSSNTIHINYSREQQKSKTGTGGGGFASRVKNLVTNRNKNSDVVSFTKVINTTTNKSATHGNNNSMNSITTSAAAMAKGFRKRRKKAQSQNEKHPQNNDGLSTTELAKSISEPALSAHSSAVASHRIHNGRGNNGDAFMRDAASIASLTSSSATGSSRGSKKGARYCLYV